MVTGFLLLLGGVGYVVDSAATLLLPAAANVTATVMMFLGLSELVMMLWLVIWGAVGPSAGDPVDLPATAS